uniref:Uncharacterized protein n=1 Tax=Gasterosteus aculeatus TaxID=69293 RepID=G3PD65_GASAC
MESPTFLFEDEHEIHDCAWIQILNQLVYLPIGLILHVLIDGIGTICGLGEVNGEPICKVGLHQRLQEVGLRLELVVHKYSGPFTDVLRCVVGLFKELLEGLIDICLRQ